MQLPALLVRLRRPTALFAFALATLGVTSSVDLHAQTAADLTPAALVGKSIECTIVGGVAPFETRGFFVIQLGGGSYSIDAASGNATYRSGTYTATAGSGFVTIRLGNYLVNNFAVEIELYAIGSPTATAQSGAGKTYFEMFAGQSNKRGTFKIPGLATGGGGGPTPAPVLTTQPAAQTATVGGSVTFTAAASGTGNTYQWRVNGNAIAGATGATYTIASVSTANVGLYSVVVTNAGVSTTSGNALLTVAAASTRGRLINLSVLTSLASATDEFTLGYVIGGTGTNGAKPLVIRAAGPSLGALGVPNTIADPQLETFAGSTKTGGNDNWGGATALATDLAAVGAFPYTGPTSRDAAVSTSISSRDNSVRVTGVAGATGAVIAEVYEATSAANFTATTPRLLNVSVRKHLGTGITAGFVLGGSAPTRVLIRVVGPGLAAFGVGGTVVDPQLALFNDKSVKIGENNDWGGSADLTAAFTSVGAFALPDATSKDAALLVTLPPGLYSVQATGVNNTTGVGIVEVYELP